MTEACVHTQKKRFSTGLLGPFGGRTTWRALVPCIALAVSQWFVPDRVAQQLTPELTLRADSQWWSANFSWDLSDFTAGLEGFSCQRIAAGVACRPVPKASFLVLRLRSALNPASQGGKGSVEKIYPVPELRSPAARCCYRCVRGAQAGILRI